MTSFFSRRVKPKFSAYLDIVRFLAALTVFLGHASGAKWTGGFLWQLGGYGDTCVVVFFVLSGYVIAYVADNKENDWRIYGANRIARLWSVVIPALALTFVIDYAGVRIAPQLYLGQPWFNGDHLGLRYLASFFLLHEAWHIGYAPGINQPFWSLGYEAFYYLIFGLLTFYKRKGRVLALLATLLVGGPLVLALLPIWMAGVWVYRTSRGRSMPQPVAWLMFIAGASLLLLSPTIRHAVGFRWMGQEIAGRYVDAFAFVLNVFAARRLLSDDARLPATLASAIKRVASTTFVLYLFHRPLMQFFSYVGPADPSSLQRRVLVIGATLAVVVVATPLCERLQALLRGWCLRWTTQRAAISTATSALPPATASNRVDEALVAELALGELAER